MLEKLEGLADRYDELENQLASPNLYDDPERARGDATAGCLRVRRSSGMILTGGERIWNRRT